MFNLVQGNLLSWLMVFILRISLLADVELNYAFEPFLRGAWSSL
jgi:hypothetical protein